MGEIGVDATRYFMLSRSHDSTIDLDLDLARQESAENPVYYVQYAHARIASVLAKAGEERVTGALAAAGAAGAIVPDLPLEEAAEIGEALEAEGLALIQLVAPTTPPERRRRICEAARGFVYVVSVAGVTGERDELPQQLAELVETVKAEAPVPAAVGFGIGTPAQAAAVGRVADGVIIGTRLVREAAEAKDAGAGAAGAAAFLRDVRAAMAG